MLIYQCNADPMSVKVLKDKAQMTSPSPQNLVDKTHSAFLSENGTSKRMTSEYKASMEFISRQPVALAKAYSYSSCKVPTLIRSIHGTHLKTIPGIRKIAIATSMQVPCQAQETQNHNS